MTSRTVAALEEAVADVVRLWPDANVEGADGARLVALNDALGRVDRLRAAAHAQVASEISRQSRRELGPDGLAKTQGFRNPAALIAATTGTTNGEAARLVQVGDATAPRLLLTGEHAPSRHPYVGEALAGGRIGTAASSAIITMLDRVAIRAGHDRIAEAEKTLAGQAPGLSMDQLTRVIARAEAWLDPDGVEPREEELRAERSLHITERRDGMVIITAKLDPEHAAPVVTAIQGLVAAELSAARSAVKDSGDQANAGLGAGAAGTGATGLVGADAAPRSIPQMQADALTALCAHILGCDRTGLPLSGATVVVRISLEALEAGTGTATIDGLNAPVSAGTARRMAAGGGIIPCVLGADSEILDWGRRKRLFTRAQVLALVERDGGCAGCGAPPGRTKAHHIRWWARDRGSTDLSNGILLCDSCHHRVHDNGWEVRIDGPGTTAQVWLIPPPYVDPSRTPRPGARRRFDYMPAA